MELRSNNENMVAEYSRESYCNNLKFELFYIAIRVSKKEMPTNFH